MSVQARVCHPMQPCTSAKAGRRVTTSVWSFKARRRLRPLILGAKEDGTGKMLAAMSGTLNCWKQSTITP